MARTRPTAKLAKLDTRFRHVVFAENKNNSSKVLTRRINLTSRIKSSRTIKIDTNKTAVSEVIIRAGVCSLTSILLMIDTKRDHFTYVDVYCAEMSNLNLVAFLSGSGLNHIEINIHLGAYSANSNVGVVCLPNYSGASVVHSLQCHSDRLTTSNLECRAVLADETRIHYHGLITVNKNAVGTDAYQKNTNMLLGERAKAYSVPKLEIEANDVRCTHGSTTTGLSSDDIFYLQSRGLSHGLSKQIIAQAHFSPVVQMLGDIKLESYLTNAVFKKIKDIVK